MSTVQSTYQEQHNVGYAGMMADLHSCDVDSFEFEGSTDGKFGYAVQRGSEAKKCKAGVDLTTALVGVLCLDRTLNPDQDDEYQAGDVASVMVRGTIFVAVEQAVEPGDMVTINPATGQFGTGDPGVGSFVIVAGGTGYSSAPTIAVDLGEGYTTVTAGNVTRSNQVITAIAAPTAANRGKGFLREPNVRVTGGGGSGAEVEARLHLIPVPGARYITSASAGGLAKLRLPGPVNL